MPHSQVTDQHMASKRAFTLKDRQTKTKTLVHKKRK